MENREAIASLKTLCNTCTMFPKCVNNKPECFRAIEMAISALEKQEQDRWRPFECREATEEDNTSFDYIMECELPEDGQTILITVKLGGHEPVQVDTYYGGGGEECALDSGYALCEEAIAWRPLPEPYTEKES